MKLRVGRRHAAVVASLSLAGGTGFAASATASGGFELTPAHKAQVTKFVDDAEGVERKLDSYSEFWSRLPQANTACRLTQARAAFADDVRRTSNHIIGYVKTAERGELKLYAYSKDLAAKSNKRHYVGQLDDVGKDFDDQLADGRFGLKIASWIAAGACNKVPLAAVTMSQDWGKHLKQTRSDLTKLRLVWGT